MNVLAHLNTWPLLGDIVLVGLGSVFMLEEVCNWGWALTVEKPRAVCSEMCLLPVCSLRCEPSALTFQVRLPYLTCWQ